jgi:hypothetical protein
MKTDWMIAMSHLTIGESLVLGSFKENVFGHGTLSTMQVERILAIEIVALVALSYL